MGLLSSVDKVGVYDMEFGSDGTMEIYRDAELKGRATNRYSSLNNYTTTGSLSFFNYYLGTSTYAVPEILIFNRPLTDNERAQLNDYLSVKYGFNLDGQHVGRDVLTGGLGADTFYFGFQNTYSFGQKYRDVITDFSTAEGDKIDVGVANFYYSTYTYGGNTIIEVSEATTLSNTIEIELSGIHTVNASYFNGTANLATPTTFTLTSGTNTFTGGNFNDSFNSATTANYSTSDTLNGKAGFDTLNFSGGGTFTLGSNLISIEYVALTNHTYNFTLTGVSGLGANPFEIDGSNLAGANTLTVDSFQQETTELILKGGGGADVLRGGTQDDIITGNSVTTPSLVDSVAILLAEETVTTSL